VALEQKPELVILGKQSIDGDNAQTGTCRSPPFAGIELQYMNL
jgi:hypothetical protein